MAAAPAAVAEALAAHDRVKRSTDLPLFYGRKDKDSITAHQLINRFDRAAVIADWNEDRQCSEFNLILRDKALLWWDALPNISEHANVQTNIVNLKAAFLDYYAPKYTAKATCNLFIEMQQKGGESVTDYYLRVDDALKRLVEAKPAAMNNAIVAPLNGVALDAALVFKREGIKQDEQFFLQQLFTAGLREDIRTKVMEANMPTIREALKVARDTEIVYNDRKAKGATINSVQNENSSDEEGGEDEGDVNALRGRDGKFKSNKNRGKPQGRQDQTKPKFDGNCRYCNKYGHSQKYCFTRKENKAPMVDAKGIPFKPNGQNGGQNGHKVHNVQEETNNVDYIAQFNSLNW